MKKDQVVILEIRGVILISGNDASDFLQNIVTNDIKKVSDKNSIFSAILTPQGIAEKTKLTINFMKRKMQEYEELKKEIE